MIASINQASTSTVVNMNEELIAEVADVLKAFTGLDDLKEIFWSILSYDRQNLELDRNKLYPAVARQIDSATLFATHDSIGVVKVDCRQSLTETDAQLVAKGFESRFPTLLLILNTPTTNDWKIVYPDRTSKHQVRFLPLPGAGENLDRTAKALSAMATVDWDSDDSIRRMDVTHRLDVFFPGAMPKTRWEFDPQYDTFIYKNSFSRKKAEPLAELYSDISDLPLLTEHQEKGNDLPEGGDSSNGLTDYHKRLVVHNIRLVINIALKFPTNVLDIEDLVQEGIIGLITAARKYDPSRGNRFSTYAWYWIRQGMYRAIANNHNLIRWPVHRAADLVPANRNGDLHDLRPGERYVDSLETVDVEASESLHVLMDDNLECLDKVEALVKSFDSLDERQRRIMRMRYGFDSPTEMTLEEVGDVEKVTRERIRQIQVKATEKLRQSLPQWMKQELAQETQHVN
eukprot:COSAG01_NODE_46_length_32080_cov_716.589319_22_plen_458_part_00